MKVTGLALVWLAIIVSHSAVAGISFPTTNESDYCIDGQSLKEALNRLSIVHETSIAFKDEHVANHQLARTICHYELDNALNDLLPGFGLQYTHSAYGVVISRQPVAQAEISQSQHALYSDVEVDRILVTSFREQYVTSDYLKSRDSGISEYLAKGDVNRIPALNLADMIDSLNNVNVSREGGRGQSLTIRGLPELFNLVQLNGVPVTGGLATAMDSRGQRSPSRNFQLSLVPIHFIEKITVNKSHSAALLPGGIAGNVDMSLLTPSLRQAHTVQVNVGITDNQIGRRLDDHGFISWEWGGDYFAFQVAHDFNDVSMYEEGKNTTRWRRVRPWMRSYSHLNEPLVSQWNEENVWVPRLNRISQWDTNFIQNSSLISAAFEYERLRVDLSYFVSSQNVDRQEYHLSMSGLQHAPFPTNGVIYDAQINNRNELVYVHADDVSIRSESRMQHLSLDSTLSTLHLNYEVSDDWSLEFRYAVASTEYLEPTSNKIYAQTFGAVISDYRNDPLSPDFYFGVEDKGFDDWFLQHVRGESYHFDFDNDVYQLTSTYFVNDEIKLLAGVYWGESEHVSNHKRVNRDNIPATSENSLSAVFSENVLSQNSDDFVFWPILNNELALRELDVEPLPIEVIPFRENLRASRERISSIYAELEWSSQVWGLPTIISAGLRRHEITFLSVVEQWGEFEQVEHGIARYLPSFSAAFEVADEHWLKSSYSKNLASPGLGNYHGDVSIFENERIVIGTNPLLAPYSADSIDLAYEWYLSQGGLLSVGLFYKHLNNYIVNAAELNIYRDSGLPIDLLTDESLADTEFRFRTSDNSGEVHMSGFELSLRGNFDVFDDRLAGWGGAVIYAYNDGDARFYDANGDTFGDYRLPQLSYHNATLQLYYEEEAWGARLNGNYRGEYLNQIDPSQLFQEQVRGFSSTWFFDFTSYAYLTENVTARFALLNLTDEEQIQFVDHSARLYNRTRSGRVSQLSLNVLF